MDVRQIPFESILRKTTESPETKKLIIKLAEAPENPPKEPFTCAQCDHEVQEGAERCLHCGVKLDWSSVG